MTSIYVLVSRLESTYFSCTRSRLVSLQMKRTRAHMNLVDLVPEEAPSKRLQLRLNSSYRAAATPDEWLLKDLGSILEDGSHVENLASQIQKRLLLTKQARLLDTLPCYLSRVLPQHLHERTFGQAQEV